MRLEFFDYYHELAQCNILAVSYRGYGDSTGKPNQEGIEKDALAIMRFVFQMPGIAKDRIYLHGRSLGGAVAIFAQANSTFKAKGIIIENTFTSINDIASQFMPILTSFTPFILRNTWKSKDLIGKIEAPILFIRCKNLLIHLFYLATNDEIVPDCQMEKLIKLATKSK